jgi:hypothetical protein
MLPFSSREKYRAQNNSFFLADNSRNTYLTIFYRRGKFSLKQLRFVPVAVGGTGPVYRDEPPISYIALISNSLCDASPASGLAVIST